MQAFFNNFLQKNAVSERKCIHKNSENKALTNEFALDILIIVKKQLMEIVIFASFIIFVLWQGSYFPIQFLLVAALLIIAFVIFGKTITITKEAVMLLGISIVFCISLMLLSENRYAGINETIRTLIYPLALLFFINARQTNSEKALITALICVALLGLLDYFSIIHIPGGVDETVGRLHSTIQYANTTALLMLIGLLYSIHRFFSKKRPIELCFGAVFAIALFLTGSRTTLLIALITCAIYVSIVTENRWKLVSLGVMGIAIITIICMSIFTDIRIFRISLFTSTMIERLITFQDALEMLRGRWLLGIGAGNWQVWQLRFQSAPYFVRFIHNYYLQLLLDGGLLAPILFCAAICPSIYRGLRQKSVHSVVLLAFMLHAFLDIAPVFPAVATVAMFSLSELSAGGKTLDIGVFRLVALAPLLTLFVLWGSEIFSTSAAVQLSRGDLVASKQSSKTALAFNPLNTNLYFQMARATSDNSLRHELIRMAFEENSNDLQALTALVQIELINGNYECALELSLRLVEANKHSEQNRNLRREAAVLAYSHGIISGTEYDEIYEELKNIQRQVNPLFTQYHRTETPDRD